MEATVRHRREYNFDLSYVYRERTYIYTYYYYSPRRLVYFVR